jgi:hypothetical protein
MKGGLVAVGAVLVIVWYLGRKCCPTVPAAVTGVDPTLTDKVSPKDVLGSGPGPKTTSTISPKAAGVKPSVLSPRNTAPGQVKTSAAAPKSTTDPLGSFESWLSGGANYLFGGGAKQDIAKTTGEWKIPGLTGDDTVDATPAAFARAYYDDYW